VEEGRIEDLMTPGSIPAIVIASQLVRAKRGPMTGSAKQSIQPHGGEMDCLCARQAGVVLPVRDRSG
jgi:hypothetical protein